MSSEKVGLYCFSGTGNTLCAARAMITEFEKAGWSAELLGMEKAEPASATDCTVVGLAFPVAAQSTYPFVWDFVKKLPDGEGRGAFMLDTMGKFSGGIVGPLKKVVQAKGYNPIGAMEIVMPNNFLRKSIDEEASEKLRKQGEQQASEFARAIVEKRAKWGRIPVLSDIMRSFSRGDFAWNLMRNKIGPEVDQASCVKCGLCEKLCPVENISVDKDAGTSFADKCVLCMRCFSFCPKSAIYISNPGAYVAYRATGASDLLGGQEDN